MARMEFDDEEPDAGMMHPGPVHEPLLDVPAPGGQEAMLPGNWQAGSPEMGARGDMFPQQMGG